MCWEQLPVGEWADCVLIVYLAIADDPGLVKMLSILSLVLKKKGCSQEEKEWIAIPPAAKMVSLSWASGRGLLEVYWGWTDAASAGDHEEVY